MSIALAEAIIDMATSETPEDAKLRKAEEIWEIAHDSTIPIMTALRQIADRLEAK